MAKRVLVHDRPMWLWEGSMGVHLVMQPFEVFCLILSWFLTGQDRFYTGWDWFYAILFAFLNKKKHLVLANWSGLLLSGLKVDMNTVLLFHEQSLVGQALIGNMQSNLMRIIKQIQIFLRGIRWKNLSRSDYTIHHITTSKYWASSNEIPYSMPLRWSKLGSLLVKESLSPNSFEICAKEKWKFMYQSYLK